MAANTNEEKCGELLFKDLCSKFEKMLKLSKSQQKLALVFNKELKSHIQGQSLFPLLRLLLPLNDTGRQKYGVKQAAVATTYIEALQLNKSSADASRLKFWKNPTKLNATVSRVGSGDFCSILEDVLRSRICMDHSSHTIASVNLILDDLARTVGQKEKVDLIRNRILNSFSAVEQKWLMRIVFQDMKIGLKYEQVLNYLAPNALQRYNECSDLRKVCSEIASGSLGTAQATDENGAEYLTTTGISVFTCFHPMLAKGFPNTGQILEVDKAMKGHPFVMDLKLDGERMLCHIANGKGMFWSRNGNDYSDTYRSLCDDVVGSVNCSSCILDGEVCAWDEDTASFIPFGHNRTVARLEDDQRSNVLSGYMEDEDDDNGRGRTSGVEGANCRLVYVVFDVLYVEGLRRDSGPALYDLRNTLPLESLLPSIAALSEECRRDCIDAYARGRAGSGAGDLLHLPLCVRRALIPLVLRLREKRIEIVRSEAVYSCNPSERKSRLESFFNHVSANGEEGLVVKDALSPYLLGMRSRQALFWVKMKPEYSDMTRDLDLIILGAYYGEGQSMRGKGLSTFLCGVRDDTSSASSSQQVSAPFSLSYSSQVGALSQSAAVSQSSTVKYKSLCKVGTGYNFQELEELRKKLKDKVIPWDRVDKQNLPPHFSPWRIGKNDDIPDVWIPPADSVVVELKCAEIVQSTQFSAGVTCRFPRLRKIRYDKSVGEVMSVSEVEEVMRNPRMNHDEASRRAAERGGRKGKGVKKKIVPDGLGPSTRFMGNKVASHFMVPKFSEDSKTVGCVFSDMVFCVLESEYRIPEECHVTVENGAGLLELVGSDGKITREQIIRLIQSNGGVVVASPVADVIVVTGDKRTLQSKSMIDAGKNNVVHFRFIVDVYTRASDGVPTPAHLLGWTEETKKLFEAKYDALGDSFIDPLTTNSATSLLRQLDDTFRNWEELLARSDKPYVQISPTKKRKAATKSGKTSSNGAEASGREDNEALDMYKKIRQERTWRDIALKFLDDSESQIFLDSIDNVFWRNKTLIYLDIYSDLGDISPPSESLNGHDNRLYKADSRGTRNVFSDRPLPAGDVALVSLLPLLQLHGAFVSRDLTAEVTHIVMDPSRLERADAIKERLRIIRMGSDYKHEKRIVTASWVHRCIEKQELRVPSKDEIVFLS